MTGDRRFRLSGGVYGKIGQMPSSCGTKVIPFLLVSGWALCFSQTSGRIDFGRDIRPLLSDKCFACHGPDALNNKSKLRFDTEAHAMAAIVRGHPEQSELVRRITAEKESMRMPPVYSGRKLTKQEIERLTEWIAQGAPWQQHWAFIAPARPPAPSKRLAATPLIGLSRPGSRRKVYSRRQRQIERP